MKKVRNSCKHLDELVVVSKELKHIYSEDFKKNDIKCQVEYIPNFLEVLPKKANKLDNKNIISVGRLEPEKGFLDLVSVFKLMELKDGDVYLNLVGDGSQKDKIFKNIVDNNNSRKVRMHGYLDFEKLRQDLIDYYGSAFIVGGFGAALVSVSEIYNASEQRLIELASQNNFNLKDYEIEKQKSL